ncbi:MAG: type IV secretion protein IcmL [Alphaproteobacteria bacterium]|nr:type IV secretion protein IcmL [Alphaproteobacteria bacterium]
MAIRDAVQTIVNRNAYYRDGYRLMLRLSIILALVILVLTGSLIGMIVTTNVQHVFFATTSDGRIMPIVPLSDSFISRGDLVSWVADTTKRVMQFGYHDYRERLQDSAQYFTADGWESFTKSVLKEARIIETITARRLVVDAEIDAAPEVVAEGNNNGIYTWVVRVPITVKYMGDKAPAEQRLDLQLTIVRVSTLERSKGIGIKQWIAAPRQTR